MTKFDDIKNVYNKKIPLDKISLTDEKFLDFLEKILETGNMNLILDYKKRLGCNKGMYEILSHPFFHPILNFKNSNFSKENFQFSKLDLSFSNLPHPPPKNLIEDIGKHLYQI